MGYHATVQAAIVSLLTTKLGPGIPVINTLAAEEADLQRLAAFVGISRERIDLERHEEISPLTSADTQLEEWEWILYVAGGAGAVDQAAKGAQVDLILEDVRDALNAQRPTAECGPMSLITEEYFRDHGNGVVYQQRWRHSRKEA